MTQAKLKKRRKAPFVVIATSAAVIAGTMAAGCATTNPAEPLGDAGPECTEDAGCEDAGADAGGDAGN